MKKYLSNNLIYFFLLFLTSFLLITESNLHAQSSLRVLFLGNSYTGVNNLPELVHDLALSAGDTLIFDSHTPGGYQLIDHSQDPVTESKIMSGNWDYVILQGQSQEPVTHHSQFINGGIALNNQITQHNPCAVSMLYMTWGRKNGDASNCAVFPVMCTYEAMDSALRNNYLDLAATLYAEVSPVSVVWNYLRENYPEIELYQADESHPSAAGSYAAACSFYASIFKKDPALITFNYGLGESNASIIRNAAKIQVFDSLELWDFKQAAQSDFWFETGEGTNEVIFYAENPAETYLWDFGDGTESTLANPTHSYLSDGTYTVVLTTSNCDLQGLHLSSSDTIIQFCSHTPTIYTSNPWFCENDTLWTQAGDTYQWYAQGMPIPENNQYLADYSIYNSSGFSVKTTLNGCSELSEPYFANPEWSGYYFDIMPGADPCVGDTVSFAVLHINGSLSGSEIIKWYKNDILLTLMDDEDTLFITSEGTYECIVINPNSNCPLDTTSYLIEFDCGVSGIAISERDPLGTIFPNPASETITIKFEKDISPEQIQIYSAGGRLVIMKEVSANTKINISDLQNGLYFLRLKNNKRVLKFIKQ